MFVAPEAQSGWHQVFVYGTLKQGFFNHYVMEGLDAADSTDRVRESAVFVAAAQTCDSFQLVIGGRYNVPFLLNAPGSCIEGEVYLVDDATLARLDLLEGVPHYYQKQLTRVKLRGEHEPKEAECMLYLQQVPSEELKALAAIADYTPEHHSSYVRPADRNSYSDVPGAQ